MQQGLQRIRAGHCRAGIKALAQVAGRDLYRLSSADLGFAIGPRLNAAGRLQDMSEGIDCLLETDAEAAMHMAEDLDRINHERRDIQAQMQDEALAIIANLQLDGGNIPHAVCVYEASWHEGVVGLIASKVKERYHRPAIAFAPSGEAGVLKGSARSIPGLHIRDALDLVATRNPGLISKFGGHAMAAGLSLPEDKLEGFKAALNAVLIEVLDPVCLQAVIESDGELPADALTMNLAESVAAAGPWGQGFPEPIFHGDFKVLEQRVLKDKHLKLRLSEEDGSAEMDAIAFNAAEYCQLPVPDSLSIAYRLDINEFRGRRNLQLMIEDIRPVLR